MQGCELCIPSENFENGENSENGVRWWKHCGRLGDPCVNGENGLGCWGVGCVPPVKMVKIVKMVKMVYTGGNNVGDLETPV